mmetsp:Transcript_3549/g.8921  ORF Transcript_3549/g.8921 Transcript_3549/m.8921 type:complete len:319 (-) Transcript_3549:1316-2272(-)
MERNYLVQLPIPAKPMARAWPSVCSRAHVALPCAVQISAARAWCCAACAGCPAELYVEAAIPCNHESFGYWDSSCLYTSISMGAAPLTVNGHCRELCSSGSAAFAWPSISRTLASSKSRSQKSGSISRASANRTRAPVVSPLPNSRLPVWSCSLAERPHTASADEKAVSLFNQSRLRTSVRALSAAHARPRAVAPSSLAAPRLSSRLRPDCVFCPLDGASSCAISMAAPMLGMYINRSAMYVPIGKSTFEAGTHASTPHAIHRTSLHARGSPVATATARRRRVKAPAIKKARMSSQARQSEREKTRGTQSKLYSMDNW